MTTEATGEKLTVKFSDLPSVVGREIGPSSWRVVTQEEVNKFADLSGDHNPIHLDQDFASKTPFKGTIVHGYFTLSLIVPLMAEIFEVTEFGTGINYGLDKLRFPAPVPVGSRIRVRGKIADVVEVAGNGYQIHADMTFEVEGSEKPAAALAMLVRYYK